MLRSLLLLALLATLPACHTLFGDDSATEPGKEEGERVAVLDVSRKPTADKGVSSANLNLPPAVANKDWPQAGGNTEHAISHPALATQPNEVWSADIGYGSDGDYKLLARPVVSGGRVFTLDARGQISAFKTKDGDRVWRFDTTPHDRDDETMGGGLGVDGNAVYVATGYGEVLALKTSDGSVLWRKMLGKPFRSAPTIADDRVYVVSIDNELNALAAPTGEVLWHHNGIAESATLMGASSPAVQDDNVVVTYSSGEIFNLRVQNGRVSWTDALAVPAQVGALPAIADIRGLPVIDRGRVFAISHSGRLASIDQRTGDRAWEADIGGTNTPMVAGDAVFVVDNDSQLIALTRQTGRIVWVTPLQRLQDPTQSDSTPVFWSGPLLAGGRLWLVNSLGHLAAYAPNDGKQLFDEPLSDGFFIPPVVANNVMYLVSDNGKLIALK